MCGSVSLGVCINWVPLKTSGLHAETINGKWDEKAETVTNSMSRRVRKSTLGCLGTSVLHCLQQCAGQLAGQNKVYITLWKWGRDTKRESLIRPVQFQLQSHVCFTSL